MTVYAAPTIVISDAIPHSALAATLSAESFGAYETPHKNQQSYECQYTHHHNKSRVHLSMRMIER
jgi:hypothetical protein